MQFQKYQHIERLGTQATEGILDGTVYVFSKLDGTNTSVYLTDSGEVEVASRNRVLTDGEDNHGVRKAILGDKRLIGSLIANTWYTFISEETFNFVKQFKNPTINFRLLNALVVHEIKARKPELFA